MKTVDEIYQEMLACFARQTGLDAEGGCDLSARLYAVAAQVYALYVQAEWVSRQCFPQTADGERLDRHAQLRGLQRKSATAATGVLRFTADAAATGAREIPKGSICMTAGLVRFETTQAATLAAGSLTVDVPARAVAAGTAGNVSAGTITGMAAAPVGIAACTNPAPLTGGGDAEGDEALRQRVLHTFRRLPNGANAAFYEQTALSFDRVAAAAVLPRSRGKGTVDVVVSTREGDPDAALLAELTEFFRQHREIAVDVAVRGPAKVSVNVSVQITAEEGTALEQVSARVKDLVRQWFNGTRLGRGVLRAELGNLIFSCPGVANYTVLSPAADVKLQPDQLPVLGTLAVEALV